jgi:phosphinothricin acetyltransferase
MRSATHLRVREAAPGDLPDVNDIYNHYVRSSHVTFDVDPTDLPSRVRWFEEHRGGRHRVLVAEAVGQVVGFASSSPYRDRRAYETTVETSLYVSPAFRGIGVGAGLYAALFERLRGADVHRAVAGIAQPNEASVALHERFGFHRVGRFTEQGRKFGRYHDVDWYERALES